ncbi:ribokinase [Mycobacterium sp. CBMA293]|uniref:ribokinase n=3 Tax=Mycolicibacterium TaxID=1866885 RepID=UPI001325A608|nr:MULTISPECIES: ribokinase [unclassified Mycolicibacterium]MUL49222.1 ribokinase [Mycolicibacterium sp. CBMA 360]MUL95685.1 ribokinase [Mycolicibacterium sp. CBMA 230]MUL60744.1 ribokinase [Mycolicibacterium sp. CBMA 335]MUL71757.1 ribokinase [Mycolicibacterium sp. CBMA 311]MUM03573.1 ribokinase [Mycolicibacterium sp. CBMA 213]
MTRITVVGSVNMDLVFGMTELPAPGATVLASSLHSEPGGKGGNQAVAAARAGANVRLVAAIGPDATGAVLRKHLQGNGVGVDAVVSLSVPSGTAAIMVGTSAENMIVVAPGANAHLTLDSPHVRAVVADCDVLLLQLEIPSATALAAARLAKASGATVMLNASPAGTEPGVLATLAAVTDVVIVNETEAQQWHWPVPHLVITRGADGAVHRTADGDTEVAAPEVEAIDSTGAGDVFAGVLAAGWRQDPSHALRRAVTAGALATLVPGAGNCAPYDEAIEDALG